MEMKIHSSHFVIPLESRIFSAKQTKKKMNTYLTQIGRCRFQFSVQTSDLSATRDPRVCFNKHALTFYSENSRAISVFNNNQRTK
jgi:hypothetical protein